VPFIAFAPGTDHGAATVIVWHLHDPPRSVLRNREGRRLVGTRAHWSEETSDELLAKPAKRRDGRPKIRLHIAEWSAGRAGALDTGVDD
jgi:hypothetical protein